MAVQKIEVHREPLTLDALLKARSDQHSRPSRSLNLLLSRGTRLRAVVTVNESEGKKVITLNTEKVISSPEVPTESGKEITSYAVLFELDRAGRRIKEYHRILDFIRIPVNRPKEEIFWPASAMERILSSSIWAEDGIVASEEDALQRVLSGRWITVKEVIRPQGHQFGKDWCYLLELDPKK